MIIWSLYFILLSFIFKAIADTIKFHFSTSIFSEIKNPKVLKYFDPDDWTNMYKDGDKNKGERFWGSSRWFAFLNDAWHLSDMLRILSYLSAVFIISGPIIGILISYILGGLVFELLFKLLKK